MKHIYGHTDPGGVAAVAIFCEDDGRITNYTCGIGGTVAVCPVTRQELADMHAAIGAYLEATEPPASPAPKVNAK